MARSTRQQIAHLLRRAGFGAVPAEIEQYTALGFEGTVERLLDYDSVDDSALESVVQRMRDSNPVSTNQMHPEYGNPELEVAIWLSRMLLTRRPLQEKMTLFWHGLFTSSIQDVKFAGLMQRQNALFRANALPQDFKAFAKQVARDPAMLIYLDNNTNRKGSPNENWARELMELFTLGIGNYTESDVKAGARAFTGWTVNRDGNFIFNANQHDNDPKTFLGATGNLNGDDIIDIIFTQPAHGKWVARKLLKFFVYDDIDETSVSKYADIYVRSAFNVGETMRQILLGPEFRSDRAYLALVKSPAEFVIGALRALSANYTEVPLWRGVSQQMAIMGQQIFNPPNVAGWPGNRSWVNSTTFYTRTNWTKQLVSVDGAATVDPREIAEAAGKISPAECVDHFLDILLQSDVPQDYRETLLKFTGSFANQQDRDGKLRGLVRLIMSTPVYQMN